MAEEKGPWYVTVILIAGVVSIFFVIIWSLSWFGDNVFTDSGRLDALEAHVRSNAKELDKLVEMLPTSTREAAGLCNYTFRLDKKTVECN